MKFGCSIRIFVNTAHLICRSTDISKCFRGSLQLLDNESRLDYNNPKSRIVWFYNVVKHQKDTDDIVNSVGPDQIAQSDQGLHCLFRPTCPNT